MSSRLQFILIGLLGGAAFWGLFERFQPLDAWRMAVPALVLAGAFFCAALAMAPDLGIRRAVLFALPIAALAAGLAALKGMAFDTGREMLGTGHLGAALVALATLPVPFALALGLGGRAGLTDYRALFTASWNIVVRHLSAGLFAGVVLLVLTLLGAFLNLVGVTFLRDLMREDLSLWLIAGATFGLGLSVVTELSDTVSPYLLLRLLRLLTPLVLAVVVIFVGALPLRGLDALFGEISAASAILATAVAAIALISIVADEDDVEAAQGLVLTGSARGLMALVPVLAGLAIWAVALRVGQYGWTPERIAAAALAGVVTGYALGYLGALGTGRRWRETLRRANVAMALAIIGLSGLWLTPLISPEAIAVRVQLARFEAGKASVTQLPLWEMAHDWGNAGRRGLERLRAQAGSNPALAAQLDRLASARSRGQFRAAPDTQPERLESLRAAVRLLPAGADWPAGLAEAVLKDLGATRTLACTRPRNAAQPACVIALVDLRPKSAEPEAVLIVSDKAYPPAWVFERDTMGDWTADPTAVLGWGDQPTGESLIATLGQGPLVSVPVDLNALQIGDWQITVRP